MKNLTPKALVTLIIENTACSYSTKFKPKVIYTKDELIKIVEYNYGNMEQTIKESKS
ncbi:MAG: hypothetical protein IIC76_14965 [Bacteroidetes bacterium]|nr:hypothetical protein [Bacteroidota bacterium]